VQTRSDIIDLSYRPKKCPTPNCGFHNVSLRSAEWQQIAPLYGTYGYDIIAFIGWQRQNHYHTFKEIHEKFFGNVQISDWIFDIRHD